MCIRDSKGTCSGSILVFHGILGSKQALRRSAKKLHAEGARKRDQLTREKGSRDNVPCRVQGQRPCWGLGQRPNCSSSNQFKRNSPQRCRQRSVPASNFARPQTRPPSCSIQQLCCVAPNGRDQVAGLATIAALSRTQGISLLRERQGGFAFAPLTPSQCTPMLLDFYRGFL